MPDELWELFERVVPPAPSRPQGSCHRLSSTRRTDGPPPVLRVDEGARVGQAPPLGPGRVGLSGRPGLVPLRDRLGEHAGVERGDLTGPNPVDRGKKGSKIHLITERTGPPLSIGISGANLHDSQALEPLVRGIPPRPPPTQAGQAPRRQGLRLRPPEAMTARPRHHPPKRPPRRRILHTARPTRWTIERPMSWLAGCRRLHRRYERKADRFLTFTGIACTLICYRLSTK